MDRIPVYSGSSLVRVRFTQGPVYSGSGLVRVRFTQGPVYSGSGLVRFHCMRNVDLFTFLIIYSSISELLLEKELGSPSTGLTPPHVCVCSKLGPGFPSSYVVVLCHKHQLSSMIHGMIYQCDIVCILISTVLIVF